MVGFLDISAGFPGSIHDARVLRMSGLYSRVLRNEILQGPYINLNGVSVGPLIVGDSAYPIFPWLLKPYQNVRNLDPTKVQFNTVLSKSRDCGARTWCVERKVEMFAKRIGNLNRKGPRNDSCLLYSLQHLH